MGLVRSVVGIPISAVQPVDLPEIVCAWARSGSKAICFAPANNLVHAQDSPDFRRAINEADLVVPDGMGVVWALRLLGCRQAQRVYGPDTTLAVLDAAARERIPVGFYGGAPATLARLVDVVRARFAGIEIAYACSPPFRPLTPQEDEQVVEAINASGARILFVGLGTPKQELWMAAHRGRVRAVMLGVGAAFDFIAGTKPQAPRWMMRIGLEWFFRLCTEPRRLWRRYLINNPRFLVLLAGELLRARRTASRLTETRGT